VARGMALAIGVAFRLSFVQYTPAWPLPMASNQLISAQFDRAVEIVQSLPKTGPIQTDYEEKLAMYRYDSTSFTF
jgi:hypothetical protein